MTTLHDRLSDLADRLDVAPQAPGPDLWTLGRKQHRRRQAGAVLVGAAAVVLAVGLGALVGLPSSTDRTTPPADVPFGQLHLPTTVYTPSKWAPGTDEDGPLGQLAAVAVGERAVPDGPARGSTDFAVFGVSAVDGSVRWLDVPWGTGGFNGQLALSPDGTKVAVGVVDGVGDASALRGWAVYDTTTGMTLQLRDPEQKEIVGADQIDFQFSGDSRYLETIYSPTGSNGSRDDALVVWDVETGERIVAEGAGHYWHPSLGSAPTGIVWSRKGDTFTFDPATGGPRPAPRRPTVSSSGATAPAGSRLTSPAASVTRTRGRCSRVMASSSAATTSTTS